MLTNGILVTMRLLPKRFAKQKKDEGVTIVPSNAPVTPAGVEKFVYHNDDYVLIYRPRVTNFMNGKKAGGAKVLDDGARTNFSVLVDLNDVKRRVAMGWSHADVCLIEAPNLPLPSEF